MAVITTSIGTMSRDYATIAAWEADLDDAGVYSASDDAVGELYDDSAFENESITFNGGGTIGLSSVKLSVAAGERHDGTAGTGARMVLTSDVWGTNLWSIAFPQPSTFEWFEVDTAAITGWTMISLSASHSAATLQRLILHKTGGNLVTGVISGDADSSADVIQNCFVYAGGLTANSNTYSGIAGSNATGMDCYNNTVFNINNSGAGTAYGIQLADDASRTVQGNLCIGNEVDFEPATWSSGTASHNGSADSTASGTGSLTSLVAGDLFVSVVEDSEDLHLKSGASAIDAGTDLVTTPTGVNIDINSRDRDAEGDTWDIGAHEFVAAGGGSTTNQSLTGTLTRSAALATQATFGRTLTGAMARSATMAEAFTVNQSLTGSMSRTASIVKLVKKGLSAAVIRTAAFTKRVSKGLTASMARTASVDPTTTFQQALAGAMSRTASIAAGSRFTQSLTASMSRGASLATSFIKASGAILTKILWPIMRAILRAPTSRD